MLLSRHALQVRDKNNPYMRHNTFIDLYPDDVDLYDSAHTREIRAGQFYTLYNHTRICFMVAMLTTVDLV